MFGVDSACAGRRRRGERRRRSFPDPSPGPCCRLRRRWPPPQPQTQPGLKFSYPAKSRLRREPVTQDWRCFLGPTHNAISTETPLLKAFWQEARLLSSGRWRREKDTPLPRSWSNGCCCSIVSGRKRSSNVLQAETGRRYWKVAYPNRLPGSLRALAVGRDASRSATGSASIPSAPKEKLHCLKLTTGQLLWKRDIPKEFHLKQNFFGVGATPADRRGTC